MILSNANIWSANISLHVGIQTNNYADTGTAKTIQKNNYISKSFKKNRDIRRQVQTIHLN